MRILSFISAVLLTSASLHAAETPSANAIGDVKSVRSDATGITVSCADGSQLRLTVLASDLIRVRAAFGAELPARDHSWAIAKTDWAPVHWQLTEEAAAIHVVTDELDVVVRRSPLLIEFREAKTHRVINADLRPISRDAKTGAVTAAKRLGVEEHFYGLGEKATRLEKRRGAFTMWSYDTPAY